MKGELAEAARFSTRGEAEIAATVLDAEGIPALVDCDDASGLSTRFFLVHPVRLLVPPQALERARELLEEPGG